MLRTVIRVTTPSALDDCWVFAASFDIDDVFDHFGDDNMYRLYDR
jgi:hypothetical protein